MAVNDESKGEREVGAVQGREMMEGSFSETIMTLTWKARSYGERERSGMTIFPSTVKIETGTEDESLN